MLPKEYVFSYNFILGYCYAKIYKIVLPLYAIKQKDDIFVFPHIGENKVFVDSFVINLKFNCL